MNKKEKKILIWALIALAVIIVGVLLMQSSGPSTNTSSGTTVEAGTSQVAGDVPLDTNEEALNEIDAALDLLE